MNHREIKFRGKALEDFETSIDGVQKWDWVEGYYYFCRPRMCGIIVTTLCEESGGVGSGLVKLEIEVDYKTVCQYTGFKDKHGTEIYCGDIGKDLFDDIFEIVGQDGGFVTICGGNVIEPLSETHDSIEIIGNIHEHPDLLNL